MATRLKRARQDAGLTQVELAKRAGCTQQTVSYLENGHIVDPAWSTVQRLSAVLGVDPREVFPVASSTAQA